MMPLRRVVRAVVFLVYAAAVLEGAARLALQVVKWRTGTALGMTTTFRLAPETRTALTEFLAGRRGYVEFDSELGWAAARNIQSGEWHHNAQGIRARSNVSLAPMPGEVRVVVFGDSFVHGTDMSDEQTWESVIERERTGWRVLNFGVFAYGTDQALLRYEREGSAFHPRVVILGVLGENFKRNVNVFRPFYLLSESGFPLTKPRFVLRHGQLCLVPNPYSKLDDYRRLLDDPASQARQIGRDDFYFHRGFDDGPLSRLGVVRIIRHVRNVITAPYTRSGLQNTRSEPFKVTAALLERFDRVVRRDGALPVVVLFPEKEDIARLAEGRSTSYEPLRAYAATHGIVVIDSAEGFRPGMEAHGIESLYGRSRHFSVLGNEIVGRYVASQLDRLLAD